MFKTTLPERLKITVWYTFNIGTSPRWDRDGDGPAMVMVRGRSSVGGLPCLTGALLHSGGKLLKSPRSDVTADGCMAAPLGVD